MLDVRRFWKMANADLPPVQIVLGQRLHMATANDAMKTDEMRELDEFCTVEVMGWKKINPHAETSYECADFSPTTDPTAAMMVLKRCIEKCEEGDRAITIWKDGHYFCMQLDEPNAELINEETLELAICLFAKQLFSK